MNETTKSIFILIGITFTLMLLVPDVLWLRLRPDNDGYARFFKAHPFLLALESSPKYLTIVNALFFIGHPAPDTKTSLWLPVCGFVLMLAYDIGLMKRIAQNKASCGLYDMLFGLPPQEAMLPIAAFILLGIYEQSFSIIFTSFLWAVGHIAILLKNNRERPYQSVSETEQ